MSAKGGEAPLIRTDDAPSAASMSQGLNANSLTLLDRRLDLICYKSWPSTTATVEWETKVGLPNDSASASVTLLHRR